MRFLARKFFVMRGVYPYPTPVEHFNRTASVIFAQSVDLL